MSQKLIIILITIFILSSVLSTYTGSQLISIKNAKEMIQRKEIKYIIDVRTNYEFNRGHYPKALHLAIKNIKKIKKTYQLQLHFYTLKF